MSAALDYPSQFAAVPHRKPLPSGATTTFPSGGGVTGNDQIYTRQPSHSHSRSASSTAMPQYSGPPPSYTNYNSQIHMQPMTRRTLSNATSSTTSSGPHTSAMNRAPTNTSYDSSIRRSTSSRSQQQPTSYVALLRRQKATVWCDRAQHEDPRVLAQQRQAKARANMEVVGGVNPASRTSTGSGGGVRSKIRHHGAVKASAFQGQNLSGAGVPMRLSASEVDDNDSDDDRLRGTRYARTGSGRSSLSSGHRASLATAPNMQPRFSTGGDVPASRDSYSPVDPASLRRESNAEETPVPSNYEEGTRDYFARDTQGGTGISGGSGSSEERGFGEMSSLPQRTEEMEQQHRKKTSDDLRRRGSVDDRTMTMSGVRLFVANPDLSD
ncbi:hypothetical protein B9Z65_1946 [Elsinoe australis]|uniref:Uncharacterized protein n=1 Tax=Elsinoe australis TaxID=40998 RepID=A0A2P7YLB7_9PEZI|nr:hypothetical protein B9Z65_1946 [Elsinoe australis]